MTLTPSFLNHLEELRRTLLRCAAGFAAALPAGFALAPRLVRWLFTHAAPEEIGRLQFLGPMEAFLTNLRVGAVAAAAFATPWCAWHLWRFLLPALTARERAALRFWVCLSSMLFICGAAFSMAAVFPLVMSFAAGFANDFISPQIRLSDFVALAGGLAFAFGAAFEIPVAVCAAVRFGLVRTAALRRARPYSLVGILVAAAALTPPDVVSQLMLAAPMYLLYEAGVLLASRFEPEGARAPRQGGDSATAPAAAEVRPEIRPEAEAGAPAADERAGAGSLEFYEDQRGA